MIENNNGMTSLPPTRLRVSISRTASGKDTYDYTVEAFGVSAEEVARKSYELRAEIFRQYPHLEGI